MPSQSDDEPRYTLDEARRLLAERECAIHGHSWDVITRDGGPHSLICSNCGEARRVLQHEAD